MRKLYWAVVEGGGGLPDAGELRAAVPSGAGADAAGSTPGLEPESPPGQRHGHGAAAERAAITRFRVHARHDGLAWLELEPITGAQIGKLEASQGFSTALQLHLLIVLYPNRA